MNNYSNQLDNSGQPDPSLQYTHPPQHLGHQMNGSFNYQMHQPQFPHQQFLPQQPMQFHPMQQFQYHAYPPQFMQYSHHPMQQQMQHQMQLQMQQGNFQQGNFQHGGFQFDGNVQHGGNVDYLDGMNQLNIAEDKPCNVQGDNVDSPPYKIDLEALSKKLKHMEFNVEPLEPEQAVESKPAMKSEAWDKRRQGHQNSETFHRRVWTNSNSKPGSGRKFQDFPPDNKPKSFAPGGKSQYPRDDSREKNYGNRRGGRAPNNYPRHNQDKNSSFNNGRSQRDSSADSHFPPKTESENGTFKAPKCPAKFSKKFGTKDSRAP